MKLELKAEPYHLKKFFVNSLSDHFIHSKSKLKMMHNSSFKNQNILNMSFLYTSNDL